jgi:Na+-driven multidrug efflux pump
MPRSLTTGCLNTRQPVDAQVSEAELATRTPEETTHLYLVEVLGQVDACPGWAGAAHTLEAALTYSNLVFAGALSCWLLNTLASIVRGTGTMLLPASVIIGGGIVTLSLSPVLILGWGPFPRLGIAGAAIGFVTYYSLGSLVLLGYLASGRSLVQLAMSGFRFRRALFWEILRVGVPASLNSLLIQLNMMLLTGLVGPFGTFALAGAVTAGAWRETTARMQTRTRH